MAINQLVVRAADEAEEERQRRVSQPQLLVVGPGHLLVNKARGCDSSVTLAPSAGHSSARHLNVSIFISFVINQSEPLFYNTLN